MTTRSTFGRGAFLLAALLLVAPQLVAAGGLTFLEAQSSKALTPNDALRDVLAAAVSPDDEQFVYTGGRAKLSLFQRDVTTGALTLLDAQDEHGTHPSFLATSVLALARTPDGTHVYVTGRDDDAVSVFASDHTTGALTFVEKQQDGAGAVPSGALRGPSAVAASPDGTQLYVTAQQGSTIVLFNRDTGTGALTYVGFLAATPGVDPLATLEHPRGIALDPLGQFVYVVAERPISGGVPHGTVVVFARDTTPGPTLGALTWIQTAEKSLGSPTVIRLDDPQSLVVSPDKKHLYVASRGDNAVVVFSRETDSVSPTFGQITYVDSYVDGGVTAGVGGAYGVAIDDIGGVGRYVYVTGENDNALGVFARDATTGTLRAIQSFQNPNKNKFKQPTDLHGLTGPARLVIAPNGKHLYVPGRNDSGWLAAFGIDKCGDSHRGVDEECDGGPFCSSCSLVVCGAAPMTGCGPIHTTTPEDASLTIKNDPTQPDSKDQLKWQWKKGNVSDTAYGDPTTTGAYVICIYDSSANPQPLVSRAAPTVTGWTKKIDTMTSLVKSFGYKSKSLTPDGLQQVQLKVSLVSKAQIQFKGKSYFLGPPVLPPGGLTLPVTVEVRNTQNTDCWEATYSNAILPDRIIRNDGTEFKAKSD